MEMNIRQTVPFFAVSDMEASLIFYVDGLGFEITHKWIPEQKIEWCALKRDNGHLMLQQFRAKGAGMWLQEGKVGVGVSINFICADALLLYHEFIEKGIPASEPFVGNNMWVTSVTDPDGYRLFFESSTDVPEETTYSDWKRNG
jgi:catechol 2,3-dioxygenase-like lactoylglutathione lyase family enzyme